MATRKQPRSRRKPKAATEDVIGAAPTKPSIPEKWRKHYNRLTALRDQLLNARQDLTKDALEEQPTFSQHMADAGTDTYDRDLALSMLSSEQDAVYEIEQALDRIRNRSYGKCELTGKPIEPARLEAIPWARFSAEAERQLEREGGPKRAHLGQRETVARIEGAAKEPEET